jgi:hypothetical protein
MTGMTVPPEGWGEGVAVGVASGVAGGSVGCGVGVGAPQGRLEGRPVSVTTAGAGAKNGKPDPSNGKHPAPSAANPQPTTIHALIALLRAQEVDAGGAGRQRHARKIGEGPARAE